PQAIDLGPAAVGRWQGVLHNRWRGDRDLRAREREESAGPDRVRRLDPRRDHLRQQHTLRSGRQPALRDPEPEMRLRIVSWLTLSVAAVLARVAPALAADWPQWRGPDGSNASEETGLLGQWPEEGPPIVWTADDLGQGVPSVAVAGGKVYVLGYRDGN